MRILILSRNDILKTSPVNDVFKIVDEVKKALVERIFQKTADDKLVISPSRETMFTAWQADEAIRKKYAQVDLDQKLSSLMSVGIKNAGVKLIGANALNRERGLPRSESLVILYTNDTFRPVCILSGTDISAFRTGAYASIVGEYLMPKETGNIVACIGSGKIMEASLLCLNATLKSRISQVLVYSPSSKSRDNFVARMQEKINISIVGASNIKEATNNADYIITATTALHPVVDDPLIKKKATVLLLGGDEVGTRFIYRCYEKGLLVCDDWELVKHRNCQSLPYLYGKDKQLKEETIIDLWQLITKQIIPKNNECVFVNCVGVPALDIKIAGELYKSAVQNSVGEYIEL